MDFYGREEELAQLSALWYKRTASLVTCRGRRRIGKSTLVERFAAVTESRFLKIEGRRPRPGLANEDELAAFAEQLADQTGAERTPPASWSDAFRRLSREIRDGERTVVLLDEISWLGHYDDAFADSFKIAWDNVFRKHDRLVIVLCGSVSGWIRENIVDNGAYMGRRSLDVVVRELPLRDCVRFWGNAAGRTSPTEIFDVLSVTGGVPRYLEEIDPSVPAAENIRRLAFVRNSVLRADFDEMFRDVVTRRPAFTGSVLRTMVDGPKGAEEVADALGVPRSGNITAALAQLEEAGLVAREAARNPETGKPAKSRRYRICDNYSRFYLKFVEPAKDAIDEGAFAFSSLEQFPAWEAVMGLQFENLVVNNCPALLPALGMGRVLLLSAAPYRRAAAPKSGRPGLQIDLLLQTRRSVCIVEIKRRRRIGPEIVDEVREKCGRFSRPAGISLKTALVYDGELAPSVEADGYFDAVLPARRLLGL